MTASVRNTFIGLFLAAVVAACASTPSNSVRLPTHVDLSSYPVALLEATLVREGDCLYAQRATPSGRWLPVWPSGFSLAGDAVMNGGTQVAKVGDVVKLGGGEYHDSQYAFLRTLMPEDVRAACRGSEYWLVSSVVS